MGKALDIVGSMFWNLESKTTHQAVALLCLVEDEVNFEVFRRKVEQLVEYYPRLKQKLIGEDEFYQWVEDEHFDLNNHLRLRRVEGARKIADVVDEAAEEFSMRIDTTIPPWRYTVINSTSFEEDSKLQQQSATSAVLFCVHHSLVDGVGGFSMIEPLLTKNADQEGVLTVSPGLERQRAEVTKSRVSIFERAPSELPFSFSKFASFRKWFREITSLRGRSPLNGLNSDVRAIATSVLPVRQLHQLRREYHVSTYDIVLCIVSGAVRRYHETEGVGMSDVRVVVPVSARRKSEKYVLENYLSGIGVGLHVWRESAIVRLKQISARMESLKKQGALGAYLWAAQIVSYLPRSLQRFFCNFHALRTNFVCTYFNGPVKVKYLCGAKVVQTLALPALWKGHGIGLGFVSYAGKLCISVVSDPHLVPEPAVFAKFLEESTEELVSEWKEQQAA